jgi:surface antigen
VAGEKHKDSCEFSRAKRNSVALKQMCLLRLKPYPSTDLKLNIWMKDHVMRTKSICSVILCCGFCLSGCNTPPTQEQGGMVIGGILGGALGSQAGGGSGRTVATVLGTLAGSVVGGNVGRSMDDTDRLKVAHSLESVRTGVPAQWRNPDTGNQYMVVPTRTYDSAGTPCREFTVDGVIDGRKEKIYNTACRQADGSWRVGS